MENEWKTSSSEKCILCDVAEQSRLTSCYHPLSQVPEVEAVDGLTQHW